MKSTLILAAGIAVLLGASAHAGDLFFDTASGSWNTPANWATDVTGSTTGSVPTSADTANFNITSLNDTATTVSLDGSQAVAGIVVNTAGGVAITGSGTGNTLTLGMGGITMASTVTSSVTIGASTAEAPPIILAGSQTWADNLNSSTSASALVINSSVTASGGATTLTLAGADGSTSSRNAVNGIVADGSSAVLSITMSGANNLRWDLSAANTYTGTTLVSNGGLTLGSTTALGATGAGSGTTVASKASIFFRTTVGTVAENLTIAGTGTTTGTGALRNVAGINTWSGTIAMSAAAVIGADAGQLTISGAVTANNTLTFVEGTGSTSGAIVVSGAISGSGGVTQNLNAGVAAANGNGSLTLSGTSKAYAGVTTVTAGILTLNTALTGTSGVNVASAGTLRGNGGSTTATTAVNGTLSPGTATGSIGTLSTGALSLSPGSAATFVLDITTGVSPAHDMVNVTGDFTLGTTFNTALTVADSGSTVLAPGTVIPFITYTGTYSGGLFYVGGTAITDDGNTFAAGANSYQIDYNNGGNSVALIVAPEPGAAVSLLGGLGALVGFSRRRRRA